VTPDESVQAARVQLAALGRNILEALRPVAEAWRKFGEAAAERNAAREAQRRRWSAMHSAYRRRNR
jgi:hypothetical protein